MLKLSDVKVGDVVPLYSAGWGREDSPPSLDMGVVIDELKDYVVVYLPKYYKYWDYNGSTSEYGGDVWYMKRKDGYRKGTSSKQTQQLHIIQPGDLSAQDFNHLYSKWLSDKGQNLISPYYKRVFNV